MLAQLHKSSVTSEQSSHFTPLAWFAKTNPAWKKWGGKPKYVLLQIAPEDQSPSQAENRIKKDEREVSYVLV